MDQKGYLDIEMSGGCQCGAIRFHARRLKDNPHVCYCRMCQKALGNLFAAAVGVYHEDLTWTRGTPAVFKSSEHVERGFCRDCGTPLYFNWLGGAHISLSIGVFDDPHRIPLLFQIGTEGKHPSLSRLNEIEDRGTTESVSPEGAADIRRSNRQHPDHDTVHWPMESGS